MLTGSTLLGLAMFVTLFLGTVLAVFVTLNAVRGDAERGLLQPLVVRPVGRSTLLLARFLAASAVCVVYVQIVYWSAVGLTNATGGYYPGNALAGALSLAAAVTIIVAIALLGTTLLSSTANGIAIFMVFGAGLAAGLIGQIGTALQLGDARADQLDRDLGAAVRGPVSGRPARADRRHRRGDRGHRAARAVRRVAERGAVAVPVRAGLRGRGRAAGRPEVPALGSLIPVAAAGDEAGGGVRARGLVRRGAAGGSGGRPQARTASEGKSLRAPARCLRL